MGDNTNLQNDNFVILKILYLHSPGEFKIYKTTQSTILQFNFFLIKYFSKYTCSYENNWKPSEMQLSWLSIIFWFKMQIIKQKLSQNYNNNKKHFSCKAVKKIIHLSCLTTFWNSFLNSAENHLTMIDSAMSLIFK